MVSILMDPLYQTIVAYGLGFRARGLGSRSLREGSFGNTLIRIILHVLQATACMRVSCSWGPQTLRLEPYTPLPPPSENGNDALQTGERYSNDVLQTWDVGISPKSRSPKLVIFPC